MEKKGIEMTDLTDVALGLINDKEMARGILKKNPDALEFLNENLKDDLSVVEVAINIYPSTIEFASPRIKSDIEVCKKVLNSNPFCLSILGQDIQNEEGFIRKILLKEPEVISMVKNKNILDDKDFIAELIKKDYRICETVNENCPGLFDNDLMSMVAIKSFNNSSFTASSPYNYFSLEQQVKVKNIVEMLKKHYLLDFEKNIQLKFGTVLTMREKLDLAKNVITEIYEKEVEVPSENLSLFLTELGVRECFKQEDLDCLDENKKSFSCTFIFCKSVVAEIEKIHMEKEVLEKKTSNIFTRPRKF